MDNEGFSWNVDDSTLVSFMTSYPRVPEHLRKRKGVGASRDNLVDLGGSESGMTGMEVDDVSQGDAGNDVLPTHGEDWEDNQPLAKLGRARRRLTKRGARVVDQEMSGPTPEVTILNASVRICTSILYKYCRMLLVNAPLFLSWVFFFGCSGLDLLLLCISC